MFTMLKTGKMDRFMDDLEVFGLLVACLCHDLDHTGRSNLFEIDSESNLAILCVARCRPFASLLPRFTHYLY